jgi:hypothetical protein
MTHRSTPAFAVGGVPHAFTCVGCGVEVPTTRFLEPRGICASCCYDHDYEYDRYVREHRCTHCDKPADADWYEL